MLEQAELARRFSLVSPMGTFQGLCEAIANAGVPRIQRFLGAVEYYQRALMSFLVAKDREDDESPHLLYPYFFSKREVRPQEVPRFAMDEPGAQDVLVGAIPMLAVLFGFMLIAGLTALVAFLRYDPR
jgi:hypothetical protein